MGRHPHGAAECHRPGVGALSGNFSRTERRGADRLSDALHGQKTAPRPISLDDIATCLNRLMEARGPLAKSAILETYFRQMTPTEGGCMVKILTGDMRIGLKEGLLEEALAEAFDAEPDKIRETHMLVGELGETARLAALGELDSAGLTVFQPIKPMLASPRARCGCDLESSCSRSGGNAFRSRRSRWNRLSRDRCRRCGWRTNSTASAPSSTKEVQP